MTRGYRPPTPVLERIRAKSRIAPDGCWLWEGWRDKKGYGRASIGSRTDGSARSVFVHVIAYELLVGLIPDGHEIDHLCEVTSCWRPDHLEAVTPAENMRRRQERRTACRRGHLRTPANTQRTPHGAIRCLDCQAERRRERDRRQYWLERGIDDPPPKRKWQRRTVSV